MAGLKPQLVVDASVAFKWVQTEEDSERALQLASNFELHAPELVRIECANALWSAARRGSMTLEGAREAIRVIDAAFATIHAQEGLLLPALQLAFDLGHPIYDCHYLALALHLDCDLVTADRRFVRAAAGSPHAARLKSLADVIS